jgi:hypothetical protein
MYNENIDIQQLVTDYPKIVNNINDDIKKSTKPYFGNWYDIFIKFITKYVPNNFYRTIFWIVFIIFIFILLPINILLKSVELLVYNLFLILYYVLYWFWITFFYPILMIIIS